MYWEWVKSVKEPKQTEWFVLSCEPNVLLVSDQLSSSPSSKRLWKSSSGSVWRNSGGCSQRSVYKTHTHTIQNNTKAGLPLYWGVTDQRSGPCPCSASWWRQISVSAFLFSFRTTKIKIINKNIILFRLYLDWNHSLFMVLFTLCLVGSLFHYCSPNNIR